MKKLILPLIFLLSIFISNGQNDDESISFKNEIALEVSDLINGTYQIKFERLVGEHLTVSLGLGYKGNEGLIKLSGIDTEKIQTGDITYSGLKIIPEVKYYISKTKQYGKDGFYIGAFVKFTNFQSDLNGTYTNDAMETFTIAFDADINVTSIGFMVGYKLPLSPKFSIDFLIAGPGAGFYNFSFVNTEDLPDEFYEDFNMALENYSLFDLLDGDFKFESASKDTKFTLPSFRYGISLGYSF